MSINEHPDNKVLNDKYPTGTVERRILDYSRGEHLDEEVPPLLLKTFKLTMVITGVISLIVVLGYIFGKN